MLLFEVKMIFFQRDLTVLMNTIFFFYCTLFFGVVFIFEQFEIYRKIKKKFVQEVPIVMKCFELDRSDYFILFF